MTYRIFGAAALFAGLAHLAGFAMAQSTSEDAPAPSNDLVIGTDADADPELGKAYTKETIGAWELRCLRTETPENDPCQMYQLLKDDQGAPVAEVSLFRLLNGGQAEAGATIIVPLETSLQAQLTVQVDSNGAKRYPFAFCNQLGCYARIGLTSEDVAQYKRGNNAVLTIVPALAQDQKVNLTLSLSGFTKTYDQASAIEQ